VFHLRTRRFAADASGSGRRIEVIHPMLSASDRAAVQVRAARPEDAPGITRIAIEVLEWSRLYDLGPRFATLLNRYLASSEHALCSVAVKNDEVVAFLQGSLDAKRLFREFVRRHGVKAALILAPKLFNPTRLGSIWRGLTYFPETHDDDPPAEILSFAVREDVQRGGVGMRLFDDMLARYRAAGVEALKVGTINVDNEASNRFFQKLGATLLRTEELYRGTQVNVYVCDLRPDGGLTR
jgi:ribosomal protein S18 acetylase RimI-like enzyme